jgi:hypothetical protein
MQAVVTPDGITSSLSNAITGNRHDNFLYDQSGIEEKMKHFFDVFEEDENKYYHLYGDAAYRPSQFMERAYKKSKSITFFKDY